MSGHLIDYELTYLGRPRYYELVYLGKHEELAAILRDPKMRAQINTPIHKQGTVLHVACMGSANLETVKLLVENGADIHAKDFSNRTALHIAGNCGCPEIIKYLLSLNARKAIEEEKAEEELESGALEEPKHLGLPDSSGRTPLHAICMSASSLAEKRLGAHLREGLQLLLSDYEPSEQIAALQQPDIYNISPLEYAKHFNYNDILEMASELGINIGSIRRIPEDSKAFDVDYWGRVKLMEAAFDRKESEVRTLLQLPGNSNNPTLGNIQFNNMNALHYAVRGGTARIVRVFLENARTNPVGVDNCGSTALHFAAFRNDPAIIEALLENDAIRNNINKRDNFGMTALHVLAMSRPIVRKSPDAQGSLSPPRLTRARSNSPRLEDSIRSGRFSLGLSQWEEQPKLESARSTTIKHERRKSGSPMPSSHSESSGSSGSRLIHRMDRQKYGELEACLQLLIDHDADVYARNNHGQTPIDVAKISGNTDLERRLLQYAEDSANRSERTLSQGSRREVPAPVQPVPVAPLPDPANRGCYVMFRNEVQRAAANFRKYWTPSPPAPQGSEESYTARSVPPSQ